MERNRTFIHQALLSGRQAMSIEYAVKDIIKNHLDLDEQPLSRDLIDELGMDSLAEIELVMQLEDEFDIEIDEIEFENLVTIDDLVKGVQLLYTIK